MKYYLFGLHGTVCAMADFTWFVKIVYDYQVWPDDVNNITDLINSHSSGNKWINRYNVMYQSGVYETAFS